ncbi:MAG TPA: metal-dependent hydrolase [Blastocatellia bacterium]|nr:metal-dependent hydrolase [Blastocatellia bacterium]
MENFSHTLLGLSLAKAGLERATPLATTALIISSNLPDIDNVTWLLGGTASSLEHHRAFTHGFVGLGILAAALTAVLTFLDRRFRLRSDPFRRPLRPFRIFLLSCLGGLGHTFMDFTNAYGVRPLVPFSSRWFYGDLVFVVDPWIWLILGSAVVWLTATDGARTFVWLVVGIIASLVVAFALRTPSEQLTVIPNTARAMWFGGLALILTGALFGWRRAGPKLARYSLFFLALYYGGMWMAHQSAMRQAQASLSDSNVELLAVWPTPVNPLRWQAAGTTDRSLYLGDINLGTKQSEWLELSKLDSKFIEPLSKSAEARAFLNFVRYVSANIDERPDGYTLELRDLRFNLRMRVQMDRELTVKSTDIRWF